jgi:DNA-binding PadR family transcriptional regulator
MSLPEITHLQFVILGSLMVGEQSGQSLRTELAKHKVRKSSPAFYQLMGRLEDSKLVEGRYEPVSINGYAVKERRYKPTGAGVRAWKRTCAFYARQSQAVGTIGGLAHAKIG